jgi:hypothetical protein
MVYWRLKRRMFLAEQAAEAEQSEGKKRRKVGRSPPFLEWQCRPGHQPTYRSKDLALAMQHPGRAVELGRHPPMFSSS